jgi:hypothetical protein
MRRFRVLIFVTTALALLTILPGCKRLRESGDTEAIAQRMLMYQVSLPVPPRTEVIVHDHFSNFGRANAESRFSSLLRRDEVVEFYARELPRRGWRPPKGSLEGVYCLNGWKAELDFEYLLVSKQYSLSLTWDIQDSTCDDERTKSNAAAQLRAGADSGSPQAGRLACTSIQRAEAAQL